MVQAERVQVLADKPPRKGKYVLYWMQQSMRARFNHALEYAVEQANELDLPILVCFGLMDDYPGANARHYLFMLQGLRDVEADLQKRGIRFVCRHGQPADVAVKLAKDAALVVCDRGYTRHQRRWRDDVADRAGCRVVEIESDVLVPVEVTSDKQEHAARTIRPKIHKHWKQFLVELPQKKPKHDSTRLRIAGDIDVSSPAAALKKLKVDQGVKPVEGFEGGSTAAQEKLKAFIHGPLHGYKDGRNEPAAGQHSYMSMHLHFGQISPVQIALDVSAAKAPKPDRDAYLEEVIVRRELAMNFVYYCRDYDTYEGAVPAWARKSLAGHATDVREPTYTLKQLEAAETADEYWNAAMRQMTQTGFMHNYMRMYWGKKILEWSKSPKAAYDATLYLNNKYFLCGRDPISFSNVAWLFGLHDRPWGPERKIFGLVRYMNAAGLERKFDMQAYVEKVEALTRAPDPD